MKLGITYNYALNLEAFRLEKSSRNLSCIGWLRFFVRAKCVFIACRRRQHETQSSKTTDETMDSNHERLINHESLSQIFRTMDPHQAQEIREAYYKAIEGLRSLADALEIADAQQPQTAGPLLNEHHLACEAIDATRKSQLGRIL
jgi:hypothetical protein